MTTAVASKHMTWESLTAGTTVRITQVIDGNRRSFTFLLTKTAEPTYAFSPYAWLQGKRVRKDGKPMPQISHLGLPEGERREFVCIENVSLAEVPAAVDLDAMTLAELRAYAVAHGFSTITKLSRPRMVAAIRKAQADMPGRF